MLEKKTSLVGTVRGNRKELPQMAKLSLLGTKFFQSEQVHLAVYQAKRKKTVYLMSTMHRGTSTENNEKKKPESILFYNKNKFGVDMLDAMCRMMSTKSGTRRWPLAVFFNILDIAGINAYILFCKKTGSKISRRKFLFELSKQLRGSSIDEDMEIDPQQDEGLANRVTCQIKINCKRNRTITLCKKCKKPVCGKCLSNVCLKCQ